MNSKSMLGVILAENPQAKMGELTQYRSLAAVPVGGKYRMIDFILSNMVNSGIYSVGVTTRYNYQSLMDHIGTGKPWDLNRKQNGLFILPPYVARDNNVVERIQGGVDVLYGALRYLRRSQQEYALIADCNSVCNMMFNDALEKHVENDADITLLYNVEDMPTCELNKHIFLNFDQENPGELSRITNIYVHPTSKKSENVYMNMFIIRRTLLMQLIEDCVAHGEHIISKDIFIKNLSRLKIFGYRYDGNVYRIDSLPTYYAFNMGLLDKEKRDKLFSDGNIYTKVKDSVAAKYNKGAVVKNSLIADGCLIEGTVENSILSRGVHVAKGAVVRNSVLMQNSEIMENCEVDNVIFDKEVIIRTGKKLMGQSTFPVFIGKHIVV